MTLPPGPAQRIATRGVLDLSTLAKKPAPAQPAGADDAPWRIDVDESTFAALVERSSTVPVVVVVVASWSQAASAVWADLSTLADEYGGRFLLARVDAEASPQVAAAFRVQSVPAALAILGGRPLPLFEGQATAEQVRPVIDQVLEAAAQYGVTGTVAAAPAQDAEPEEPVEEPLPPRHQEAYDAIERDDLDGAISAYRAALLEDPRDEVAKAGLVQVELMARLQQVDHRAARERAAADPSDVVAALEVADLDFSGGHVDDAFARLLDAVRTSTGDDRNAARQRLLDYFVVLGPQDERVPPARALLTSLLY